MAELDKFLTTARNLMDQAGKLTLKYYGQSLDIIEKADGSPVTEADKNCEIFIRQQLEKTFPDHGIHGEEFGPKDPKAGCSYTWFIDPIDGTKSFIHGVPLYSCLLGLVRDGESIVGVIELPALGQQMVAAQGMGCFLNKEQVRVSPTSEISQAVVLTSDFRHTLQTGPLPGVNKLWEQCKFPRSWGDAFGYTLIASGRAEIMLDCGMGAYDIAPMPVIMKEAGGCFSTWEGKETIFGTTAMGTNKNLHQKVLEVLREGKG
jgi:histidinol-phosphatase